MLLQRRVVFIVNPLEFVLSAQKALFMILVQMVLELVIIEKVLIAVLAEGMHGDEIILLIECPKLKVIVELLCSKSGMLIEQQNLIGLANSAEKLLMIPGQMQLVILGILEVLFALTAFFLALKLREKHTGSLCGLISKIDTKIELLHEGLLLLEGPIRIVQNDYLL